MKNQNEDIFEIEALERDLHVLEPFLEKGMGSPLPSDETMRNIHQAALKQVTRKKLFWRRIRFLSAAASLVAVLTGVSHFYLQDQPVQTISEASAVPEKMAQESTIDADAELLLSLQGLDSESYFTSSEEEEALWQ